MMITLLISIIVSIIVYYLLSIVDKSRIVDKPKIIEKLQLREAECKCFFDDDLKRGLTIFLNTVTDEQKKPVVFKRLTKAVCAIKRVWGRKPGWVDFLATQSRKLSVPSTDRKGTLKAFLEKEHKEAMDFIRSKGWLDLIPPGGSLDEFFVKLSSKAATLNFSD